MSSAAALSESPSCCCYLDDDRFPCEATEHEDLAEAMRIVLREARACARLRYQREEDRGEGVTEWQGEVYDTDVDATAQEIGRTLSGEEYGAFTREFKRRFAELAA